MKEFRSTFIGIPLPDKYLEEFGNLLETSKTINPGLELVDPATPHITIYYLDKQSESNLKHIRDTIEQHTPLVRDGRLIVGGMDTFGGEIPKVLFLPVDHPQSLVDFANVISRNVAKFIADDSNLPFHPHMTVAYFNPSSQSSWEIIGAKVEEEMRKIKWDFPITEVAIYGAEVPTEQFKKAPYRKLISVAIS